MTVIDSSAFLKFLLKEDGYQYIKQWLHPDKDPHSVSMLLAEVGNVLWKYHRMSLITEEKAGELYNKVVDICKHTIITIESNEQYGNDALHLAMKHDHPFYDMLFIAQAIAGQRDLITCDKSQATIAEKCGINVFRV